jgi:hypothetical protein
MHSGFYQGLCANTTQDMNESDAELHSAGLCRYACTLIFPIRVALQLAYSLRHGEGRSHKTLLEIVPPKFRYIIDKVLYLVFLTLIMLIDPLPSLCPDISTSGQLDATNATFNSTLSGSGKILRRIAARGGSTAGGSIPLTRQDDEACVTEYSYDQKPLEIIVIIWLCAMMLATTNKMILSHQLARRIHQSSLQAWLDIWTVLDVFSIILALSVVHCGCCCTPPHTLPTFRLVRPHSTLLA